VHILDRRDNVRRLIAARELTVATSIRAKQSSDFRRGLTFTAFPFVA
jgi:hypothetical protein